MDTRQAAGMLTALAQAGGIVACLAGSTAMLMLCWCLTLWLPAQRQPEPMIPA